MKNTNFQEDYSSQIPALRMLINLGYTYLSKEEVMPLRYNRTSNVLLEPILKDQLAEINEIQVSSTQTEKFTQSNIDEAVLRLKEIPMEQGYAKATEYIYDRLLLGTTLDQTIEGNKREYTLQYIDWKYPENNVFHIAEEFSVLRTDGKKEYRPDIVLFVNGIPLSIIENKREDMDDPIGQAISQHLRNEKESGIRKLYVYSQIMMACAVNQAKYGTNNTPPKFWNIWREKEIDFKEIETTKNKVPSKDVQGQIMEVRKASEFFGKDQAELIHNRLNQEFALIEQDVFLFSIASPNRLLDLIANFILYDNNVKKIARYQQYFAVKSAVERIRTFSPPSLTLPPVVEGKKDLSSSSGRETETTTNLPSPSGRGAGGEGINFRGNLKYLGLLKEARQLRKNQTKAEEILWQLVRNKQLDNLKFRRQHQIGPYIVDFYCHDKRLIVELDGGIHNTPKQQKHDQKRDRYLKSLGFNILRFPNKEVYNNVELILRKISDFDNSSSKKETDSTHNLPSSSKEASNPPSGRGANTTTSKLPSPLGRGAGGEGKRLGGVVWHTQGSGKSLTMAMMAKAIAKVDNIKNPKIILVTDRTDLDQQISKTFAAVGMQVDNAKTGKHLIEILESNSDNVVTTIINKFDTAVRGIKKPLTSPNIFVLIDEGHRTQHGTFNVNMQKALPNACYMAFTGTPLFKKDKNTMHKFGGMIDQYTVKQAVEDGAVLPLVYEGRYSDQSVDEEIIDNYFNYVSEELTDYERADLKKKFAKRTHIADAEKNIEAIAWDIVRHYRENFQGTTPFKGQIVCNSKRTAVKYFDAIRQMGKVSCALVISPPDDREGEESTYGKTSDDVKAFWGAMMDQYGNSKNYEESIIKQFKHNEEPELIIVVDKLLTGFDAPKNTVLYLTRKLKGHTLLQAIARVNRLYEDKDYGYIIDYAGVISELDNALLTYSDLEDFDEKDLEGTLTSINQEIEKLEPAHQQVLEFFKDIKNRNDGELFQQKLRHKDVRDDFYKKLAALARIFKLAMSSMKFHKETPEKKIKRYKDDLKFFMNLRTAVAQRYSDKIDYKIYEGQIQKLMDQHIASKGINKLTELVNIFDETAFQNEIEKTEGTAAKADKIASRTAKHINEKMDEDPVFYKKFSQLIRQAIDDFYAERISELEFLERVKDYNEKVLNKTDTSIPEKIRGNQTLSAYFGIVNEFFEAEEVNTYQHQDELVEASIKINEIINDKKGVNWSTNQDILNKMKLEIGDYIYDEIGVKMGLRLNFTAIDEMAERMIDVAKAISNEQ